MHESLRHPFGCLFLIADINYCVVDERIKKISQIFSGEDIFDVEKL